MKIAIAGASGLIGQHLCREFLKLGYSVTRLARGRGQAPPAGGGAAEEIPWDPAGGRLDPARLEGFDLVVNLAGAGMADSRWTPERKELILGSRVQSTGLLSRALASLASPPRLFLNMSAIGYYGALPSAMSADESWARGAGFVADVVDRWEAAAAPALDAGVRTVLLRAGPFLAREGGMLKRMLPVFKAGIGGRLGSGGQVLSWVALDELLPVLQHLLEHPELTGPVNLTAPGAVTNAEFSAVLAGVLHRPALMVVPDMMLEALYGEMAGEMLLKGARVVPARLLASGYVFRFPQLRPALTAILRG